MVSNFITYAMNYVYILNIVTCIRSYLEISIDPELSVQRRIQLQNDQTVYTPG